jgi:hypothetical protein
MIKYFPFTPAFDLKMGTSPMKDHETIVELDDHYLSEINLKRSLLAEDHPYYFDKLPGCEVAEWETLEKTIDHLLQVDSHNFILEKENNQWTFINKRLGEKQTFIFGDNTSLPLSPLDWIGRQVQEDLIILNASGEVVAGQLCFPSGWALHEKIGNQFMEVHAPLPPVTNPMIQAANKLLERLPANKPVTRNNWGFRYGDQLDLSTKHSISYKKKLADMAHLSHSDFGNQIFLRVEHQTLSRLPSNHILFTIHTYHSSLATEASDPWRVRTMYSFLQGTPAELIAYKVMAPFYEQLLEYLEKTIHRG